MPALWIANVNVTDEERYKKYVAVASVVLPAHGGEFIARGGRYVQLEGQDHARNVIARFPSMEAAMGAYNDSRYQAALEDALPASDRQIVVVEVDS